MQGRAALAAVTALVATYARVGSAAAQTAGPQPVYGIRAIGLIDPGHGINGLIGLNAAGQVAGTARRDSSGTDLGVDAWLYSPTTGITGVIGVADAAHTRDDGYRQNYLSIVRDFGVAEPLVGQAFRYAGSTPTGADAWLYSPGAGTTVVIGLNDAAHTGADGFSYNNGFGPDADGDVPGFAERFNGSTNEGYDSWFYSAATGTTQVIGPTDPAHTRSDGYAFIKPFDLAASRQVAGGAVRYNGAANLGEDAWVYSPATHTTRIIGLTDAAHTRADGYTFNLPDAISATGQVAGTAERYSGTTDLGVDAWVDSPSTGTAQLVGLADPTHTRADGYRTDHPYGVDTAGDVAGTAARYLGTAAASAADNGTDAWFYSAATGSTRTIGLTDADHTGYDGYVENDILAVNAAGLVAGYAQQDGTGLSQDLWVYDPTRDTTFELNLPPGPVPYADPSVSYLGDDGTLLGSDANGQSFRWTVAGGVQYLAPLIQGGLAGNGLTSFSDVIGADGTADLAAEGVRPDGTYGVYLLTPVPEPASLLLAVGVALLARRRRRSLHLRLRLAAGGGVLGLAQLISAQPGQHRGVGLGGRQFRLRLAERERPLGAGQR